ncbi:MAG: reverse transcriptase family protein, partial [Sphingomonadales bacterium]|nr:reverse transcriptase family protein [Sphingomonadales bacterium]
QLRPITLLNTDYKLLTKMLVNRLLPVLPDICPASQLCAVKGRSIFDGAAAVVSAASFLHQHQLPGYLVSLDFYHAYDRVCMEWVDKVLAAMGFGETLRSWVATLHRGASAVFMLNGLSREIEVLFSLRQGDPLAQILYVIQEEPFLIMLEAKLHGLRFAGLREASLAYVDDVSALSSKIEDLLILDEIVSDYEAASGAILNRNTKTVIMGLGSWEDRRDWPLQWIQSASKVKLFGVHVTASFHSTQQLSWEHTVGGLEAALRMWASRLLPYLTQRIQILHTYAMSKLWYMAQILPLPKVFCTRIRRAASDFLWRGRLERLAWPELAAPKQGGGLAVACVETRARSLFAKQAFHRLASGGRPARHLSYWLGLRLLRFLPGLRVGLHAENPPPVYAELAELMLEVLGLDFVRPDNLRAITAKNLYRALKAEAPTPKIKLRLPTLPWTRIWGRLALAGLPQGLFEAGFNLLNNILPTGERRHRLRLTASPACDYCQAPLDNIMHAFTGCTRVNEAWEYLLYTASRLLGGPVSDMDLLFLKFSICGIEIHLVYAVLSFAELVCETRGRQEAITPLEFRARLNEPPKPFKNIFKL